MNYGANVTGLLVPPAWVLPGPQGADRGLQAGGATPVEGTYDFADLTAGGSVSIHADNPAATINLLGTVDPLGAGRIDARTNGSIDLTDQNCPCGSARSPPRLAT